MRPEFIHARVRIDGGTRLAASVRFQRPLEPDQPPLRWPLRTGSGIGAGIDRVAPDAHNDRPADGVKTIAFVAKRSPGNWRSA